MRVFQTIVGFLIGWQTAYGQLLCSNPFYTLYNQEVIFLLDGLVTSAEFTQQIAAVNTMIKGMHQDTKVGIAEIGSSSSITLTPALTLATDGVLLTYPTTTTRKPYDTIVAAQGSFTAGLSVSKLIVILTNGPLVGTSSSPAVSICEKNSDLKADNIETVIIGVGEAFTGLNARLAISQFVCLTNRPNIITPFTNDHFYTASDWSSLSVATDSVITNFLCVDTSIYQFTISEIKTTGTGLFVEILNRGRLFTANDVTISGTLASGKPSTTIAVAQGKFLVLSDGSVTSCSTCANSNGVYETVGGGWTSSASGWTVTITIGITTQTVTHNALPTGPWFIAPTGFSYVLSKPGYYIGYADSWETSYTTEGNPGDYQYSGVTRAYPDANQKAACSASIGQATCASCFSITLDKCDCSSTHFSETNGYNFYAPTYDPYICRSIPKLDITEQSCQVFKLKSTSGATSFTFTWLPANTDGSYGIVLNYWDTNDVQQLETYSETTTSRTFSSTQYSLTRSILGTAGTIQFAVFGTTGAGNTVNCTFKTLAPTLSPTISPTSVPSLSPTKKPTPPPVSGTPYIYLDASSSGCGGIRCGCIGSICEESLTEKIQQVKLVPGTVNETIGKAITIFDGIGRGYPAIDPDYSELICVTYEFVFLQICQQIMWNTDNGTCLDPIRTREELASRFLPPLDLNDSINSNFTFTSDIEITPINGTVCINGTGEARLNNILFETAKYNLLDGLGGAYYSQYLLNLTNCTQMGNLEKCAISYPSSLIFLFEVGEDASGGTIIENQIPTWIWWIIIPLILLLCCIALCVYKSWWKNKETNKDLEKEQHELNDVVAENELGFGHDLDTNAVKYNPLAKGNPMMTRPADTARVDPNAKQNTKINDVASVPVEKFNVRQDYGQTQAQSRWQG